MVARVKQLTTHVRQDHELPKFAYHPAFEGASPRQYLDGLDALLEAETPPNAATERRLFGAMHYCGYRARQARGRRVQVTAEARRWIERRESIRNHLIAVNVGLAYEMLRRTQFTNVDEDELLSEALRRLCDAVESFDPWRGDRLSTYACNAIYRGFSRLSKYETRRAQVISFGFDSRMERGSTKGVASDWDDRVYAHRLERVMDDNLADLTDKERYILQQRFPERSDVKRETLDRLGREMRVSKEQVRKIQISALEKIRRTLVAEPVLT